MKGKKERRKIFRLQNLEQRESRMKGEARKGDQSASRQGEGGKSNPKRKRKSVQRRRRPLPSFSEIKSPERSNGFNKRKSAGGLAEGKSLVAKLF